MSETKTNTEVMGAFLGVFIINPLLGGWALQYVLNYWAHLAPHPAFVPFWPCALVGLLVGKYGNFIYIAWLLTIMFGWLITGR